MVAKPSLGISVDYTNCPSTFLSVVIENPSCSELENKSPNGLATKAKDTM